MITLKTILVATDFGEAADSALAYGRALAERFDATMHVLHVAEDVYTTTFAGETYTAVLPELQRDLEQAAREKLHELLIDTDRSGPPAVPAIVVAGAPAIAIVEYAKAHDVDLIVMGTHGRGALAHMVMGSVAERVVRLAPCPVLTVRHPEHEFIRPDTLVAVTHGKEPRR